MKKYIDHVIKRSSLRALALIMAAVMIVSAAPSAIALEIFRFGNDFLSSPVEGELTEQRFELMPEDGVTITLEGLMPCGGHAEAAAADIEGEDILHAYDITIYHPDGSEYEPGGGAPISVSFSSEDIAVAIADEDITLEVEHIADNGVEESVEIISAQSDTAVFEAESFSIYVIKQHDDNTAATETPRIIYHFLSPNYTQHTVDSDEYYTAGAYSFPNKHNDPVTVQIIKDGEKLQDVVLPSNNDAGLFYGWYKVHFRSVDNGVYTYDWGNSETAPERQSFNTPIAVTGTGDQDVYLAPLFGHYRFLTFHQDKKGGENANMIIARKLVVLDNERNARMKISDVRAPSSNPNRIVFWGWEYTHNSDGDTYDEGTGDGGKTEIQRTVNEDDSEIQAYITIHDDHVIEGVQPSESDIKKMIFDIWPVFKEARWFYFDTGGNGADYVPSRFVTVGEPTDYLHPRTARIPLRTGYQFIGWWCKVDNGDGTYEDVRVTDKTNTFMYLTGQPMTAFDSEDYTLNTGVSIQLIDGKKQLVMDETAGEQYFYARWLPVDLADFQVIIWKQKVSDHKDAGTAGYSAKSYDYEDHAVIENAVTRYTPAYNIEDFISGGYTELNFKGFEYSHVSVSNGYNGGDCVNPDGSTVVNVYYDRVRMKITYFYRQSDLSTAGQLVGDDTYVATSSNSDGPQYGLVNGSFVELSSSYEGKATYVFPYSYSSSAATNATMFGIVDGGQGNEYVPLTRSDVYSWSKSGYAYTPTTITNTNSTSSNSPTRTQYVLYNGGFSTIYSIRNNIYFNSSDKVWYRTRSGSYGRYSYSNPITEAYTRSSVSSGVYTGDRYAVSGYQINPTSSADGTQYGKIGDVYYTLSKTLVGYEYSYNDSPYPGTRYTRKSDNKAFSGTVYYKNNQGEFVVLNDVYYTGEIFGQRSGSSVYEELTSSVETVYTWTYSTDQVYTGTRYLRYSANTGDSTFRYKVEWEGLYDQDFLKYNYSFPEQFTWNEDRNGGATGQTLLDGFTVTDNDIPNTDYKLYSQGKAPNGLLYHLRQKLDGTYSMTETNYYDIAHVRQGSLTFKFTNKFDGFEVCGYSTSFSPSAGGVTEVTDGVSKSINTTSTTYYVYHRRMQSNLSFNENYGEYNYYELENIKYEQPLAAYEDAYTPAERKHYTFVGWYEDITCTQEFNFKDEIMPNANKVLYARWVPERYLVTIDADGGEMPLGGTFSTYFNVNYNELIDEYAAIQRGYVEDDDGTYVYFNFTYEKLAALAETEPRLRNTEGKLSFPGALRKAFYIKASEVSSFFNDGDNAVVGDDHYSYKDYLDLSDFESFTDWSKRYSPVPEGTAEYGLFAWYKVEDDGSVGITPYNFMNHVDENTHLIAKWVRVGKYSITYDPMMRSTGITGEMSRYNDPLESDRKYVDGAAAVVLQAPTSLRIDQYINPDQPGTSTSGAIDASDYVFRGWRIVDMNGKPKEDNVFYDPGDTLYIDAKWADSDHVIHMEAYYEKKESTIRRVDYTKLTMHANPSADQGGTVNRAGLANDKHEYADLSAKALVLDRQVNNVEVHLKDYIKNFSNTYGYKLLGWDTDPTASPNDYIPLYYADAVIGVDKETPVPNDLYAVWEPMVYLTLMNDTGSMIRFDLGFDYTGTVYDELANSVESEYLRQAFSAKSYVTRDSSTGVFTVELPAHTTVKLVLPEGEGNNYTLTGSYSTSSGASNLIVYNSGSDNGISIIHDSQSGDWKKNDGSTESTYSAGTPVGFTTSGELIRSTQGQLIMFTASEPTTTLNLETKVYDVASGEWTEGPSGAVPSFDLEAGTYTVGDTGTSVKLINNIETVKFGMHVTGADSNVYKFIGWYDAPYAAPNAVTIDGLTGVPGSTSVSDLTVPQTDTTYYALFVPYADGGLTVSHIQKADSAGKCADTDGLLLDVTFGGNTAHQTGDKTDPVVTTISVSEKSPDAEVAIRVGAKAEYPGLYALTYLNDNEIPSSDIVNCTSTTGYYEYSRTFTVSELLTASDTVKGLMTLKNVNFYSVFSLGYTITYRYTARDGRLKDYVRSGSLESYDESDFKEFIIENTPYTRTLTGDTVWNTDNMIVDKKQNGVEALLEETPNIRDFCRVTVKNADGSTSIVIVEYGSLFSQDQMNRTIADPYIVDSTDGKTKYFDHWEIFNTFTGDKVSDCYNREFHFAVWNNYTIKPVYTEAPSGDPSAEWKYVSIDYIDTSRNQWNKNDNGTISSTATDKVIADMDIAFNDGTNIILDTFDDQGKYAYKLGVIFEQVGTTADGRFDESLYRVDTDAVKTRVRNVLAGYKDSGSATDEAYGVSSGYYYTRININEDTVSNFNRSEFARSFNTSAVGDKVFRVYAYMVTPQDEIVLSDPYYMTMYEVAHRSFVVDAY